MDVLLDIIRHNKPMMKIRSAQVNGAVEVEAPPEDQCQTFAQSQIRDHTTQYAGEYQKQEETLYSNMSKVQDESEAMSMVDYASDMLSSGEKMEVYALKEEQSRKAFSKYNFDKRRMQSMVIDDSRDHILSLINTNSVVIIEGPTGCGKTTQVPQFILDDCKANNNPCKIVITQPRRIAAISVARRVCEEREWALGTICGYQVGLESQVSNETLISYVTTGVLLQKLIGQKNLHDYTHIIVDEVHERTQDVDFLLLIIRRFLYTNSFRTKVILMSATFNSAEFSEYFKNYSRSQLIAAPIIKITKASKYNTHIYYVDDLQKIGQIPTLDIVEPKIDPSLYSMFVILIRAFDKLDPINPLTNEKTIGNVLVFLPGIYEIEEAHGSLVQFSKLHSEKHKNLIQWHIVPLHSSITTEEQRKVFQPPPPDMRKIILSTNIAESSITVPDVLYVVDFCLTKTLVMDADSQYQSLQLQWASQMNCIQRAGRVGRVADGRVYRLVTRQFYEYQLSSSVQPEILRAPLNQLVLKAKLLELNQQSKAILALAMNPPNLAKIDSTILFLKEIGALSMKSNSQKSTSDGDLTFLGRVMANLPLDVHLSKMIFLGHIFSCLQECIIMATGCSLSIFKTPFKEQLKAYINQLTWADGSASDLISYYNIYMVWQKNKRINNNNHMERTWCQKYYVSQRTFREWSLLVKEIQERLEKMQIRVPAGPGHVVLSRAERSTVAMVVICGAFYPYYFKRSCDNGQVDEREAVKVLGGRDPFNTVYFTGFDSNQPGPLYAKTIKNYVKDCGSDVEVGFDNSSKVYITFASSNESEAMNVEGEKFITHMPGKIKVNVYRAIRMRQLTPSIEIPVLEKSRAWELAEMKGIANWKNLPIYERGNQPDEQKTDSQAINSPVLPALDVQFIKIKICEVIECGHFWAHNYDDQTNDTLAMLYRTLNLEGPSLAKVEQRSVSIGGIYAAYYKEDEKLYRCKVVSKQLAGAHHKEVAHIIFIDFGNTQIVNLDSLYELPRHEVMSSPPQAIECFLSEIQPASTLSPQSVWSDTANETFKRFTLEGTFFGKVYSVIQGVVHLELYKEDRSECNFEHSLNHWLVKKGFAERNEESFLSKENHHKREQLLRNPDYMYAFLKEEVETRKVPQEVEPPPRCICSDKIRLKGPFSPLEMTIYSIINSGINKYVKIEGTSVNAVLLNSNPQDLHERLIVAAHVGQNFSGTQLTLKHTTFMPNIHGLPMLMSLLFCPTMETKPTEDGLRFAAILCGLGSHSNSHQAIFPPHDICLFLDTNLTNDDINKINTLRYWMNISVQSMESNYQGISASVDIKTCQKEIKKGIFELLKEKRESVEKVFVEHANIWGKCAYYSELLIPGKACIDAEIWPLHSTMQLNTETAHRAAQLKQHLNDLEEISLRMKNIMNEIVCQLCNQKFYSVGEVRIHMTTKEHRDAVQSAHGLFITQEE